MKEHVLVHIECKLGGISAAICPIYVYRKYILKPSKKEKRVVA
jgi:hypothetical protein